MGIKSVYFSVASKGIYFLLQYYSQVFSEAMKSVRKCVEHVTEILP